ncbi:MAG: sigma-54-dependent Fis family transcriptional regulator [Gemmatimonadales bacterium]|nr:MAG: sigma-54-dependent Fis family transcriptional regulator [Gemmatimonadales bacterium]
MTRSTSGTGSTPGDRDPGEDSGRAASSSSSRRCGIGGPPSSIRAGATPPVPPPIAPRFSGVRRPRTGRRCPSPRAPGPPGTRLPRPRLPRASRPRAQPLQGPAGATAGPVPGPLVEAGADPIRRIPDHGVLPLRPLQPLNPLVDPNVDSAPRILVVDDDPTFRNVLEMRLQSWGYQVQVAEDAEKARRIAGEWDPHIVLSDVVMPQTSGLYLLRKLRENRPDRPVVLLTAHGSVEMAVEAMKVGAVDFLTKPLNYRNLKAVLEEVLASPESLAPVPEELDAGEGESFLPRRTGTGFGPFVGSSDAMSEFFDMLQSVARSDASVMITGESGTGKELAARTIHELSPRRHQPFVAMNTAAIPAELMESELFGHEKGAFTGAARQREGCFEMADGGTLFLDEIGEMPAALQPKLLRVLDGSSFRRIGGTREMSFDTRVLAATNRNPREAVEEGRFREDLFFRLNVLTLHLPALRDRKGDIPLLAQHFAATLSIKHGGPERTFAPKSMELLDAYPWPGNVREFRNVVERAVILARDGIIEPSHLPAYVREPQRSSDGTYRFPAGATAEDAERELILQTLDATGNNKSETARRLGLSVRTIRNKLNAYGIDR